MPPVTVSRNQEHIRVTLRSLLRCLKKYEPDLTATKRDCWLQFDGNYRQQSLLYEYAAGNGLTGWINCFSNYYHLDLHLILGQDKG